ncbi:MAG: T9SS type A sorting domain-containing protein [Paludibacteraceae bacterium]|nr:T9SS type A sorting domain-containing protein [Paludibacteraceae bacterium]
MRLILLQISIFYDNALFSGDWCSRKSTGIEIWGHKEQTNFVSPLERLYKAFKGKSNLNINKVYTLLMYRGLYNSEGSCPRYLYDEDLYSDEGENLSEEYFNTYNNWYIRFTDEFDKTNAKNEVLSLINRGTNFVVFGCHGYYDQLKAPAVMATDINTLSNGELLPVVFCGMPCHTGNYNEYCLAESFIRKENGGAIAYIGNTTKGISPVSGYSTEKLLKRIILDNKTKVADVNNTLWAQDLVDNELLAIKKLFCLENHFFGDPAMDMFTTSPQCLNPIVTKNGNKVTVNTQGVKNCKITITDCGNPLNTERMKVYTLQGNETQVVFDGIDYSYVVTVQKPNHYMYTSPIPDKYIQNETFENNQIVSANNIYAGYSVTEALPYGNVVVKNGNISFKASNMISLKSGFSVKTTASKFEAKICEIDNEIEERECVQNTLKSLHITESQDEVANEKEDNAMLLFDPYPNPTTDIININLRNEVADIIVYNSFGKTLRTITSVSGSISIDLSKYDKGIYFVTVKTDGHVETNKVVLQ